MNNELAHVPGDWAALRWAGGCLLVALGERILSLALLDVAAVRVIGALLIGFRAFAAVFATALTLAYRSNALVSVERLGAMTPGDDYTRLVPLIEAVPLWLHSLWMLVAALYVAAIAGLLRRSRAAYVLVVAGVVLEAAATLLGHSIAASVGVVVNPNPSALAVFVLPVGLPLIVAFTAWSGSRRHAA